MIEMVPNWHPIWVHFPIALLSIATLLFVLGSLRPQHPGAATATTVARWNLALGMMFLIPSLLTGYLAYNSVAHDSAGHEAMHRHLYAAWITVALFVAAGFVAWRERRRTSGAGLLLLVLILPAAGMLSVTGYLGAENVYRHGIGVERLPDTDDHHHGEHHDDAAEGHAGDASDKPTQDDPGRSEHQHHHHSGH